MTIRRLIIGSVDPRVTRQSRWLWGSIAGATLAAVVGVSLWVGVADTPAVRVLLRLYADQEFLRAELQAWGVWAPLVFIAIQAFQVVVAPIPGEVTGFLGGFVFGEWIGLGYSMIGLTAGSFFAFAVGRWLGAAVVQRCALSNAGPMAFGTRSTYVSRSSPACCRQSDCAITPKSVRNHPHDFLKSRKWL